ncbi:MAG: hypothetical protein HYU97_09155 [Deltaproteobacteria bacterium]|nr:hypothetical protein [Deltaproteobacteria bacterium]
MNPFPLLTKSQWPLGPPRRLYLMEFPQNTKSILKINYIVFVILAVAAITFIPVVSIYYYHAWTMSLKFSLMKKELLVLSPWVIVCFIIVFYVIIRGPYRPSPYWWIHKKEMERREWLLKYGEVSSAKIISLAVFRRQAFSPRTCRVIYEFSVDQGQTKIEGKDYHPNHLWKVVKSEMVVPVFYDPKDPKSNVLYIFSRSAFCPSKF